MLRIDCPFCGLRNHDEFTYLEDGSVKMPAFGNQDTSAWFEAVFLRDNPRGPHIEDWHHTQGCRMVVRVKRDTLTHAILKTEPAHPAYKNMLAGLSKPPKSAVKSPQKTSKSKRAS